MLEYITLYLCSVSEKNGYVFISICVWCVWLCEKDKVRDGGEIMKYGSGFSVPLENKLLMKRLLQQVDVLNWRWAAKANAERSGTEWAEEMPIYHFTERNLAAWSREKFCWINQSYTSFSFDLHWSPATVRHTLPEFLECHYLTDLPCLLGILHPY